MPLNSALMVLDAPLVMNEGASIRDLLQDAADALAAVSDSPRLDAELLMACALDLPRSYLFAHPEDAPDAAAIERFRHSLARRLDRVPLAYVTGEKEFWSLALTVSPATLVPRPETELVVQLALARIPRRENWRIADLGTGSGAIALAIAAERPLASVVATDISGAALAVAELNARRHGVANVSFRAGSWTAPLAGERFQLVVSNPPYVAERDPLLATLRHEPREALAGGDDGLDAIRALARDVPSILADGGALLVEHGADQSPAVTAILEAAGWRNIATTRDLAGLPRVTAADIEPRAG